MTVEGLAFTVRTLGSGSKTFVLVHGIGTSSRYFAPLAAQLARHGTVLLIEMPGFAANANPRRPLTVPDFAHLVERALEQLDCGPATIIGHSMGCQVVVEVAILNPAAVTSLVLLGPTVNRKERTAWKQGLRLLQDTCLEPPAVNFIVFSDYARCGLRWYLKTLPQMLGHRLEERIGLVSTPVLILRGKRDPIVPERWTRELAEACRNGTAETIEGGAHVMMFRHAAAVAAGCLAMLSRTSDAAAAGMVTGTTGADTETTAGMATGTTAGMATGTTAGMATGTTAAGTATNTATGACR
ncbi:alpha/beta hydrolase [Paenarthrobacter sp. Z7-10]|nr:alpha/beta hydrolase [Paenarthrobacter sp. Z7-10]